MSDGPRSMTKILRISQDETISGRNSVTLAQTDGTATATSAQAHGYSVGDYVRISGANQAGYNGRFRILTVPSTTTFTFAVAASTVSPATGTIKSDKDCDCQGMMLAALSLPSSMTGAAITFQGDIDGSGTYQALRESDNAGAAISWAVGAADTIIMPSSTEVLIAGLCGFKIVSGSAEAEARTFKAHFIRTNM